MLVERRLLTLQSSNNLSKASKITSQISTHNSKTTPITFSLRKITTHNNSINSNNSSHTIIRVTEEWDTSKTLVGTKTTMATIKVVRSRHTITRATVDLVNIQTNSTNNNNLNLNNNSNRSRTQHPRATPSLKSSTKTPKNSNHNDHQIKCNFLVRPYQKKTKKFNYSISFIYYTFSKFQKS